RFPGLDRWRLARGARAGCRGAQRLELRRPALAKVGPRVALVRDPEQREFLLRADAGAGAGMAAGDILGYRPARAGGALPRGAARRRRVAALRAGRLDADVAGRVLRPRTLPDRAAGGCPAVCGADAGGIRPLCAAA